jgi:hypothetical protein
MSTSRKHLFLDGEWDFIPDTAQVGIQEEWFHYVPTFPTKPISVPYLWPLDDPTRHQQGWYFRDFNLDEVWQDYHVELCCDGLSSPAELWLNDHRLGLHDSGTASCVFNVAAFLQKGANRLSIRVAEGQQGDDVLAGIWGAVVLRAMYRNPIESVFVQPDIRRKQVTVDVVTAESAQVHLQILGTPFEITGSSGTLALEFTDFECWSTVNPQQYVMRCELLDDNKPVDVVEVSFGMREFTVKDNRFYLNNRPIYVKAVFHNPEPPEGAITEAHLAECRHELELAKNAGFNMICIDDKVSPEPMLNMADELGILVGFSLQSSGPKHATVDFGHVDARIGEAVSRFRNHPSVALWSLEDIAPGNGEETCQLVRSLDPSRVILQSAAADETGVEPARLMRPYREVTESYHNLLIYQRAPVDRDIENYFRHVGLPDTLNFLHGFGASCAVDTSVGQESTDETAQVPAMAITRIREGFEALNLGPLFKDLDGLFKATERLQFDAVHYQLDAVRGNGNIAAYCYRQLRDLRRARLGGLLDGETKARPALKLLKQIQRPLYPIIQMTTTNLTPRQEVSVTVLLANEERIEGRGELSLQIVGPTGQVLWKKKRGVKIPRHRKELWTGAVAASGSLGTHKFVVRLIQSMRVVAQASVEFFVFERAESSGVGIHVLDPHNQWQARCAPFGKTKSLLAPIHIIPPLANTIRAYPDNELTQILAQVKDGAVALFFSPPPDWNDYAEVLEECPGATSQDVFCAPRLSGHYVKIHPVFNGLPSRGFMRQTYRNVIAPKAFLETGDEDISGVYNPHVLAGPPETWDGLWCSNILVRRYGSGRLVFTHLRILEHLGEDPVADRLLVNLLTHFARRSVPPDSPQPTLTHAVEWLRNEYVGRMRRWMILGEFLNEHGSGHDCVYPPESGVELDMTYPGWYRAIQWTPWYSSTKDDHLVDLGAAFVPVYQSVPRHDSGTGYAYAEFSCDQRQHALVLLGVESGMKVWLNGALIHENVAPDTTGTLQTEEVNCFIKQGRNAVLVKCSGTEGPLRFALDFEGAGGRTLPLNWWK